MSAEPTLMPSLDPTRIGTPTTDPISLQDIYDQGARALQKVAAIRERLVSPLMHKSAPNVSSTELCSLCGIEKHAMTYRLTKGELPQGTLSSAGHRRSFTIAEAREWVRAHRAPALRPAGKPGCVVALGNFKGGSTKTTTAMTLAQGLSLRGHSVLAIDMDPQASLTQLFGILSDAEVDENETLANLFLGDEPLVDYAIKPSYWAGIDLIPASSSLFNAEFALPARQMKDRQFQFWDVLNSALAEARQRYDVIVVDTPPALSYLTINAFLAADGLVVPVPPGSLDFASSAHFWALFGDLARGLESKSGVAKTYDFIHVLLSRVNTQDAASGLVRQWIAEVYGDKVLPVVIPQSAVTSFASAMFGTVYDLEKYEGSRKTFERAKEAYDAFCDLIEHSIQQFWAASAPHGA
jgi:chromosome partitioning protein